MKGMRLTETRKINRVMRKKKRGRETDPRCDIMFTSNKTEVGFIVPGSWWNVLPPGTITRLALTARQ